MVTEGARRGQGQVRAGLPHKRGLTTYIGSLVLALMLSACGAGGGGGDDADISLRFSALLGPDFAIQQAMDDYAEQVTEQTDGQVTIETSYGGSLLTAADTISGLNSQRADMAYFAPVYEPASFPLWNVAMVPGIADNAEALARALTWLMENNEYLQDELERNGIKVLGNATFGPLDVAVTKERISSVADLEGLSLRAVGPLAVALSEIGARPVAIEAQDAYESIERGVIAGTTGVPLDLVPAQGIHEVAPWVASLNYGTFGAGAMIIGLDTWNDLPTDVQETMTAVAEDFTSTSVDLLQQSETEACKAIIDAGGGATMLPDDEAAAWRDQMGDSLIESWRQSAIKAGASEEAIDSVYADLTEKVEEFTPDATYESGLTRCIEQS